LKNTKNPKKCEQSPNCYFKQLKRLQEENKKLKNKNNDLIEEIASGNIDIAILQKENEELKKKQITKNGFICDCEQNAKYKQALEEIREVLEYYANSWVNPLQYPDLHYNSKKAKDALLKVDEVLNDRN
jgi:predicted nuclease with TOPRIM domain